MEVNTNDVFYLDDFFYKMLNYLLFYNSVRREIIMCWDIYKVFDKKYLTYPLKHTIAFGNLNVTDTFYLKYCLFTLFINKFIY